MRQLKITQQITTRESESFNKYLQEINLFPLLTIQEEIDLSNRIKNGDEDALKKLVEGNLRFVVSVAKKYQGVEKLSDLVNSGNEGLIKAAKRFDNSMGFKFISYGVWWVRQSIMQYLTENSRTIRIPSNKLAIINKIKKANSLLEQKLNRNPTSEEISEELLTKDLNLNAFNVEINILSDRPMGSLDVKLNDDSDTALSDMIVSDDSNSISEKLNNQDLQKTLRKLFHKKLSVRENDVIVSLFGLFENQVSTLEEVSKKFELTTERVRQIRERALRKLRFRGNTKEMREYVYA